MNHRDARLRDREWRRLAALLGAEERGYRRLLRLAWRQNSYMKRQDVDRLAANAAEWEAHLPAAEAARVTRERFCADLRARLGTAPAPRLGDLLDRCGPEGRQAVTAAQAGLRDAVLRLARQNELNRHLAAFCLDLAREETRIFRDCVLDDPSGCYGRDARNANRGAGGVLVRQA